MTGDGDVMNQKNNKELILQSALELFYEKGYEGVGVQEIATRAGVTKPTLYYYFKSKYGLLESLLETKYPAILDALDEAERTSDSFSDKLLKVASEYIRVALNDKQFFYIMLGLQYSPRQSEGHRAIESYNHRMFDLFTQIFEKQNVYLGNMNGRQEQFAIGFMGILNYYILVYYERNQDDNLPVVTDAEIFSLVHQFMHGIFS